MAMPPVIELCSLEMSEEAPWESIRYRNLESTLNTPHGECLAIDGLMYRRNCRPSRFRWRHRSVRRAAFPGSKSHLMWAQVLWYLLPLIWHKPHLIRPWISTNEGWDWYHTGTMSNMGHIYYFNTLIRGFVKKSL